MWDFFETVRRRHSVRRYQPGAGVDPDKLHAMLEMACAAPSAGDMQAYRIVVVSGAGRLAALAAAAHHQDFVAQAPLALVFCADPARSAEKYGARGERLYALQDATIAATYAQLAAVAAGLASAWVGDFDEDAVRATLELDASVQPVAVITVGVPAELPEATPRRPLADIVLRREDPGPSR